MGVRRLGTLLSLACLLLGPGVRAEAPAGQPTATRPRIGLVLGGGGARGGAHLGVLRVMEELRIPVDALAGTSMGSLVGALYAQGYSPDEIGTIIEGIPWTQTFRDAPDRQLQSFRTKQDDYLALFPFELGVGKSGVSAKAGAITGSKIDFLLRGLTLESAGLESFDQLPIPYRAVAMDLKDGEMVVLDHGDLARAMRASMSVPGVFTPVEIDGRILVDGGMARNIPVDVVRTMGVDRVLAVDVGTPPKSEVRDLSSVGVLSQTLSVLSERNRNVSRGEIGPDDFLLTPELGDFSAGDFEHIAESIAIGEAAARAHVDELRRFSVSEQEYAAFLARQRRKGRDLVPSLRIDAVEVEGVDRVPADLVRSRIRTRPGSVLDLPTLAEDIVRVWQLGDFESVGYRVDRAPEGNRLVIEAREKSWGPGYLRFGMAIRSDFQGEADFRLIGYHRRPNLNRLGAEWKTVVALGNPFEAQTEFYQPLSAGGWWFVAPRWDYTRDKRETYLVDGTYEVLKTAESGAGLDFGVQLRNHGEIRVGATLGDIRIVPSTTSSHTEDDRDTGGLRVQVAVDKLDDPFFPTRGHRTLVRYFASREGLGADDAFDRLQVETQQAWTRGRNTFVGKVELGSDLGSDLPYYAQFELGGFMQLSGYERGELWGDVKLLVSLADYWKVADLGALGPFYAGAALQAGDAWLHEEDVEVEEMQTSLTLFGAFSTKLAPVFLGVGFGEEGRRSGYLVVGRAF